jgi:hypothetical protein
MRLPGSAWAFALGTAAALPGPALGQSTRTIACPSLELASQLLQKSSAAPPEGCRTFVLRRDDTTSKDICVVDLAPVDQGVLGDVLDSAVHTRWWLACASLAAP